MKKLDFQDIKGQEHCKRAMEVACAGNHGMLFIGPHKSGKTYLIKRIPTITDIPIFTAEMLPCPCGNFTDPKKECRCTPTEIQRYLESTNPEWLAKAEIHIEVPRLTLCHLSDKRRGESSADIKARIEKIRQRPTPSEPILDKEADELLKLAILELGISAKSYDKIIKVAVTIARLDDKTVVEAHHISEAISYRSLDRNLWG